MACNFNITSVVLLTPRLALFRPFFGYIMKSALLALIQGCGVVFYLSHNFLALIRSELPTTDTLDAAIANPANTGLNSHPNME